MAFPVRIKLTRKDTGETFKAWATRTGESDAGKFSQYKAKFQLMPHVTEDGNIGFVDFEGFYLGHQFLKPAEWRLDIATKKDRDGKWVYEQIGY